MLVALQVRQVSEGQQMSVGLLPNTEGLVSETNVTPQLCPFEF